MVNVPCVVTLKPMVPILATVAVPVELPLVQLCAFQSSRVVPLGQTSVGGVPAVRVPVVVKLTAASSSSFTDALFGVESRSATDDALISASFWIVVPSPAVTVTFIVNVRVVPAGMLPTVQTPVALS